MEHKGTQAGACKEQREKSVVALGMFDGVHAGHRQLLGEAAALAKSEGLRFVVYTFRNHPLSVLGKAPKLLSGPEERVNMLRTFGADCVAADDFSSDVARTEPEAFARALSTRFSIAYAVAGFNFTFGRGGVGNVSLLKEFGTRLGFSVREVPPFLHKGEPVSSTRIRALIECGEIGEANDMLKREYSLTGPVVRNRRIGTAIGFPTANLGGMEEMALPGAGVYATRTLVEGKTYKSVTSVGKNPTVDGKAVSVETHIMEFDRDIYGKTLQVFFVGRLREEMTFSGVDALAAQIARDVEKAKAIL